MTNIHIHNLHSNNNLSELNTLEQDRIMGGRSQYNVPGIGDIGGLKAIAESPEAVALLRVLFDTGYKEIAHAWLRGSLNYRDVVIQLGIATGTGNTGINIATL